MIMNHAVHFRRQKDATFPNLINHTNTQNRVVASSFGFVRTPVCVIILDTTVNENAINNQYNPRGEHNNIMSMIQQHNGKNRPNIV